VLSLPAGAIILDVGCGNGKYFDLRSDIFVIGSDRSHGLTDVAARRVHNAQVRYSTMSAVSSKVVALRHW
jgi:alkylated DNA repair protein alkB family protein 8